MPHPEIELDEKKALSETLLPIYSGSEKLIKRGVNNKFFQTIIREVIKQASFFLEENLPSNILSSLKLIGRREAYQNIHFPQNISWINEANKRLKFEEAFFFQLGYGLKKQYQKVSNVGIPFPLVGDYFNNFYQNKLPFELTNAQKRVLKKLEMI